MTAAVPLPFTRTSFVLREVLDERERQTEKHGDQSHLPDGTDRGHWVAIFRQPYRQCAEIARLQVDHESKVGKSNFASIILEEVFEALAETNEAALRTELVQVAAVAVQWIEAIDRRQS